MLQKYARATAYYSGERSGEPLVNNHPEAVAIDVQFRFYSINC
ncbi:hypothetical protein B0O95_102141 [Mycetohabitans endofungorum]|uniref:Uncharacterized protein n=1 Tax=Mycetohabitans endofungorum TaxID=417203 RepID=A0A2P5KDG2_9BURK|nr:hypothetical protein B0O95_102141 [Mycetohabitans endofungorum]